MLTQNITLDFCRNDYKTITVKQRDKNSRNLLITCTDNGAIYKINNSTQECKYKMSTPDNRAIYKNATINTDGTVLITFDDNMLYELGTGKLEIQILEQATKRSLSTMILNVVIIGNVFHDDVITASDEFSALTDTLLSIEDSANKAKDTVELANKTIDRIEILETEVSSNEANRINTENERINAENIRIQNENKRQENTSKAIANAEKATESAIKATNDAISATEDSLIATELANTATTEANKATENTIQATSDLRELEEQVSSAETQRIANEEVRQSNEEKRQTDTSTAITNVEKATSDANTATENANIATQKVNKALEDLAKTTQSKADAIICEAEGTTIVATDSSDAGLEGLSLYGKSKQGSTTGAQLFDVSTIIIKHITPDTGVMYDNDSWRLTEDYIKVNPLSDYCISQSTDVYFQFSIYFYDSEKTYISCKDMGGHFTKEAFTTTENTAYIRVAYSVKVSGNDVDRGNIMLNEGSEPLPWEKFTGNKPSPNPEYLQDVVGAGQKLVEGNQLFDKDAATLRHELYAVDGSTLANPDYYVSDYIEVVGGASYYLKKGINAYGSSNCFYDANKNFLSTVSLTQGVLTVPSNAKYLRFNGVISEIDVTMLNAGTTALPYEPYTGGVKKTVDTGITMKLMGKNWLKNTAENQTADGVTFTIQEDDSVIVNGTAKADIYFMICGKKANVLVQAGVKYKVSGCPKGGSADTYRLQFNYINSAGVEEGKSDYGDGREYVTYADGILYTYIYIKNGTTVSNLVFKPMIRLASIEDDTYEPYEEKTLTLQTPNGLPGIKVTDASLATYTDENGQMWCADEIDVERGVYVQRVKKHTIDNVLTSHVISTPDGLKWQSTGVQFWDSALNNKMNGTYTSVMCDKFTLVNQLYENSESTGTCISTYGHASTLEFRFRLLKSEYPTEEDAANAINGTTVYYPLATPIETPLTDEEIAAYKALHTNKPTTTIMNSENVYMKAKYVADTKNHIKQNYIPLSKYTALEERVAAIEELVIS